MTNPHLQNNNQMSNQFGGHPPPNLPFANQNQMPKPQKPTAPSLPPSIVTNPARFKFEGQTYKMISTIGNDSIKPNPGVQAAVQTLIGTMLSHGIAALQSEYYVEIKTLNNLKIIESLPQDVEEKDEKGKTATKTVITLKLEYKYRKDGKIRTVTTEIKDELKLNKSEKDNIAQTCQAIGYDEKREIKTAQKAYLKAMELLNSDRDIFPEPQTIALPPFQLNIATLNDTAKEIYKHKVQEEENKEKTDEANENTPSTTNNDKTTTKTTDDESTASKETLNVKTDPDPESTFKNPFMLRAYEKKFDDPNSQKSDESTQWDIPLHSQKKGKNADWTDYLCKGIIKNKKGEIIAESDIKPPYDETEASNILKKLLIEKKTVRHFFRDPLNHLNQREKILLKRLILLFQKARYEKASSDQTTCNKSDEKVHFTDFTNQILSSLNPSQGNTVTNDIINTSDIKTAHNLKDHIDKICQNKNNPDLMQFVGYIEKQIKRKKKSNSSQTKEELNRMGFK